MSEKQHDSLLTRSSLLKRVKNLADQTSWRELYDTYREIIYNVATKAGLTHHEAEDVVQETYRLLAAQLPGFAYDRARGSFKGWLLRLVRCRVLDEVRKRDVVALPEEVFENVAGEPIEREEFCSHVDSKFEEIWEEEWTRALLEAAQQNVRRKADPRKFQIFDLYVNKDWPPQKVAALFSITIDQVYLTKHRVTEMLKEEVTRMQETFG